MTISTMELHRRAEIALRALAGTERRRVDKALELLRRSRERPLSNARLHRIHGDAGELWVFRATPRLRVVFVYDESGSIRVLDIVSHAAMRDSFPGGRR